MGDFAQMDSLYQPAPPLSDVSKLAWRHKGKMLVTGTVVLALTLAYLSLAPRTYLSEAKVYVRVGRESVTLDPTATTGQFVAVNDSRETEINAVEELLASRALAEKVVDQFGPEAILEKGEKRGPSLSDRLAWLNAYNLNPLRVYSLRDKAIEAFQEQLGITTGKKTSVIAVSYQSESPEFAQEVLSALLMLARDEHLRVNRTKGSLEFFEEQSHLLHDSLAKLEEELRGTKHVTGLSALATQRDIQLQQIGTLEGDLLKAQADEDAARAEVLLRKKQLADSPAMVVTEQTTGLPQTPRLTMREKLYDLEAKEQELASRYQDGAPLLVQIRSQIAETRKIVEAEDVTTQVTRGVNQVHNAAELALQEREAQLTSLTARTQSLVSKIAAAKEGLKELNEEELRIVQLEREIEITRTTYRRYADNLEQARIDQELHDAKISSLNLMQSPTLSPTPISPNPKVTLALGMVVALLSSVGVALLAERRRQASPTSAPQTSVGSTSVVPVLSRPRLSEVAPANPR